MSSNTKNNRQTTVVFDLDHTITKLDTYLAFLLSVLRGRPSRLLPSVLLLNAVFLHKIGLKDNSWLKEQFLRTIVGGASREQVDGWTEKFIAGLLKNQIYPTALKRIEHHRKAGCRLLMASASFDFYVTKIAQQLGFDDVICTRSTWGDSDTLMGEIDGNNCYGQAKLEKLRAYFGTKRDKWYVIGYSDHHSDAPMLDWVDQPVAVNPTKKLRNIAEKSGYDIQLW